MSLDTPARLLVLLLSIGWLSTVAIPAQAAPPRAEQATTAVDHQLRASGVPAASYAVLSNGSITTGSVGDGVSDRTPFVLGSLSKSFTALAVLQLVDAERLDLEAPVTRYLPDFSTAAPATTSGAITVRQLLTQTSGLPTSAGLAIIDHPQESLAERVTRAGQVHLVSTPGATFHYSNLNYAVLGRLLEEVTGEPFGDYVQKEVFDALGMKDSFTSVAAARSAGLAPASTVWFGLSVARPTPDYPGGAPDGFLVSTARDMGTYLAFQLGDGTWNGTRVLPEESMQLMHTAAVLTPVDAAASDTDAYAMGWAVGEVGTEPLLAHDGDAIGYHAEMALLPTSRSGLVLLTARNGALTGARAPFTAGLAVLAGEPPTPADRSFTWTYVVADAVGAVVVVLLVVWLVHPRWRRRVVSRVAGGARVRGVLLPVLGHLLLAGVLYAGVFWGLGVLAVGAPMSLRFAFGFVAPDVSALVLVVCAALVVRAALAAVVGVRAGVVARSAPSAEAGALEG